MRVLWPALSARSSALLLLTAPVVMLGCADILGFEPGELHEGREGTGGENAGGTSIGGTSSGGTNSGGINTGGSTGGVGGGLACSPGDHVCNGTVVEVCDSVGEWLVVQDCAVTEMACVVDRCEEDLLVRLRFEEGSGLVTVDDASGFVGSLVGPVTWDAGQLGSGLMFSPSSSVNLGDVMNSLTFPVTLAAWVKISPTASTNMVVVATDTSPQTGYAGFWLSVNASQGNLVSLGFGNAGGAASSNRNGKVSAVGFASGVWTHIAGAFFGPGSATIWIDGVDAGGSYSGTATTLGFTAAPAVVGQGTWGGSDEALDGTVDEVRVYERALLPSEVLALALEDRNNR